MRLSSDFITQQVGNKQILVSAQNTKFHGIVYNNKTAAYIVDLLKNDTTKEQILAKILEHYDCTQEIASADIEKVLDCLREIGALEE